MFTTYTPAEVAELLLAGSKNKKAAPISQEEKLFGSIKHVRLFDEIDTSDVLSIVKDVKINRFNEGDTMHLGMETKERIYYIITGSILMPIGDESHVEMGKDQIFGEVSAFTKTVLAKTIRIAKNDTMIFSFCINKNMVTRDNARSFAKFYETLLRYSANKLLWFEMV